MIFSIGEYFLQQSMLFALVSLIAGRLPLIPMLQFSKLLPWQSMQIHSLKIVQKGIFDSSLSFNVFRSYQLNKCSVSVPHLRRDHSWNQGMHQNIQNHLSFHHVVYHSYQRATNTSTWALLKIRTSLQYRVELLLRFLNANFSQPHWKRSRPCRTWLNLWAHMGKAAFGWLFCFGCLGFFSKSY